MKAAVGAAAPVWSRDSVRGIVRQLRSRDRLSSLRDLSNSRAIWKIT